MRMPVKNEDGSEGEERKFFPLDTHDKDLAKRKLAKIVGMLERGELVADAVKREAIGVETVEQSARAWCKRRKEAGVAMADTELGYFENHIFDEMGAMLVTKVGKANVKNALQSAMGKGMSEGTIGHLRRMMFRFFRALEADEIITANPVRLVAMSSLGRMKKDKRPFMLPTDEEIAQVIECPAVDVEIKLVIFVARSLGGARGSEVNRWTWEMIDTASFSTCVLQRAKGDDAQALALPEMLRPFLRAWWIGNGCPATAPCSRSHEARGEARRAARAPTPLACVGPSSRRACAARSCTRTPRTAAS